MAVTANYTSVGKPATTGAVSFAPTTATLPTSATAALTGFTNLGYISEDGLKNNNSMENTVIHAWGGDPVLSIQTSKDDTFTFSLIEALNVDVLKAVFGDSNVSGTLSNGLTVQANATEMVAKAWVIDMVLTGGYLRRIVIPSAKVTSVGEISYTDGDAIGYEITLTAVADASGNTHYEYTALPSSN